MEEFELVPSAGNCLCWNRWYGKWGHPCDLPSEEQLIPSLEEDRGMQMEKAMAPHSSTLAWKIPGSEEPGRLQSMVQSWIWLSTAAAAALFLMVCFFSLSFFFFWLHGMAFAILVSWPGIEPRPTAVKASSPNHWTAREFPLLAFCKCFYTRK